MLDQDYSLVVDVVSASVIGYFLGYLTELFYSYCLCCGYWSIGIEPHTKQFLKNLILSGEIFCM